ncbi:hypothetical protein CFOL_v3_01319 [Cephalotus follicularis]|uniref:Uncharacterized protein n=1 Tax=Cephalotus follicularis TaxID=3775 RepID=A0A1Q3AQF2_CEPFO|nr:hypothetical protein CFOL_v3_01319 [Cephalotus follicularis]
MAASVDTPSPTNLNKESTSFMGSSPSHTPSSDKRLWSALRSRIDLILESRNSRVLTAQNQLTLDTSLPTTQMNVRRSERVKGLKEDSMLLLKGFDSIAHTLSQLSNNLDSALQGARDLAKPPTLTEIFNSNLRDEESREESEKKQQNKEGTKKGTKRKFAPSDDSVYQGDDFQKENEEIFKDNNNKNMKKAKNLAVSMATKATSLARELKSIKSDLCFMQDRCTLLEEENRRLHDGFAKGIRPEEDDLVRLQLEALLSEKSRLANENANLTRENQCLHQLVEYHQITSQDLSTSYEQVIQGMCLDFSSPMPSTEEDANKDEDANNW